MGLNKYCMVIKLKKEFLDEYKRLHKDASIEILKLIQDAGAQDLDVYLYKNMAIVSLRCEDIDKYYEYTKKFEIARQWNEKVNSWSTNGSNMVILEKIFDLKEQLKI